MMESRVDWAGNASALTADAIRCLTVCRKDRGAQSPTKITLPCASRRMRPSRGTAVSSGCSSRLTVGERDVPMAAVPPSWLLLRGVECTVCCSLLLPSQLCSAIQYRGDVLWLSAGIPRPSYCPLATNFQRLTHAKASDHSECVRQIEVRHGPWGL